MFNYQGPLNEKSLGTAGVTYKTFYTRVLPQPWYVQYKEIISFEFRDDFIYTNPIT